MVNNEQFNNVALDMIKSYLAKKEINAEGLAISVVDESTIGETKKALFATNKTEKNLFETVLDLVNNKAHLTVFLIEDMLSFDITVNEKKD